MPLWRIVTPRHAFPLQLTTNTHTHIIRIREGNHVRPNQKQTISGLVVACLQASRLFLHVRIDMTPLA